MSDDIRKQVDELFKKVEGLIEEGKYNDSFPVVRQIRELVEKHLGEEDPLLGKVLNVLGLLHYYIGEHKEAEDILRKAVDHLYRTVGKNHTDYASSANNLGLVLMAMSGYTEAEEYFQEAVKAHKIASGEDHQEFATGLHNLGLVQTYMGKYPSAEDNFLHSINIKKKVLGEQDPLVGVSYTALALLYQNMGGYSLAERYYTYSLSIIRETIGEDHPTYGLTLVQVGHFYSEIGDFSKAETHYKQANEILQKTLGEEHPRFALNLHNIGSMYLKKGDYSKALPYLNKASDVWKNRFGEKHGYTAASLNNLGVYYSRIGNYEEAEALFQRTLEIQAEVVSEEHPRYADTLLNFCKLLIATGRENNALDEMNRLMRIYDKLITQVFSIGSEKQKIEYLAKIKNTLDCYLSLVSRYFPDSHKAIQFALDLVLRRKSITAEVLAAERNAVLQGKYPVLKDKLKELTGLKMQIAQIALRGPGAEGLDAHKELLKQWSGRKDRLEAELARQVPEFNLEEKLRETDWEAVAKALPEGAALAEFVRYNVYDFQAIPARGEAEWKPARYLAFVLTSKDPDDIQMIDLGEAERIDKLISDFRMSIFGETDETGYRSSYQPSEKLHENLCDMVGSSLREAVFDKIASSLKGCSRLFAAPDGDLCRVPFETIPIDGDRYLIDDFQISYLSVGRDVMRFNKENISQLTSPLVVADPDFDMGSEVSTIETDSSYIAWRQSKDFGESKLHFNRLPGTRPEGARIADLLGVKPWFAGEVLENRMKNFKSPSILHVATHGFFLEDQEKRPFEDSRARLESPLLRSGLALAGANTFMNGGDLPEDAEDGILTAEDISGLDLLNTELVVLSACDTGLGVIHAGEGVFGLQRAFTLAGAKTLVMSLWKVPDLATPILMERFYDNLLNRGLARNEALREAQLYVRDITVNEIRSKWLTDEMIEQLSGGDEQVKADLREFAAQPDTLRPFKSPAYWGAFICHGDPGPIQGMEIVI